MGKLSLVDRILLPINWLASLLLLLSYLSQFANPAQFWFIAIIGLAFPGLVLLNFCFSLYWMMKLKKQFILPALSLIICIEGIPRHFQISKEKKASEIYVSSFNAQVFDHYSWKKDASKRKAIYQFLKNEPIDVMCFQEYFESRRPFYKDFTDSLNAALELEYVHKEFSVDFYGNLFGLASFSRYPILSKGKVKLEKQGTNICIYTDILFMSDTLRIYNMHLASLHLKQENYELLENFDKGFEEQNIKAFKGTLMRIKEGYLRRKNQVDSISKHIQSSPYPVIVCGDFNDGPESYTYRKIASDLKDSFVKSGTGFGNTYNGRLPALRIDYILHSEFFESQSHTVIKEDFSDHFPIVAGLSAKD